MEQLVIYQQNMCGYNKDISGKKRELHIREKNALIGLMKVWISEKPDVIFLSEVSNHLHNKINTIKGYRFIEPVGKISENDTAACLLAIKNEYQYNEKERCTILVNKRYVEGTLKIGDFRLECFFAYVPQAYDNTNESIFRKRNMLDGIKDFLSENKNELLIIAGDLNTDINDENAKCKTEFCEILNFTVDTVADESKKESTWNGKRLDYALISSNLGKEYTCTTEYVSDTGSDHKGLLTVMTKNNE